jgi:uncharacterized membrane protein YkvI
MTSENKEALNWREILKFAGAFIAWVIGSGFATGQEILRFFTSYGIGSYGVVLINLIGFLLLGQTLMLTGFDHRVDKGFRHFEYYCGKRLGKLYFMATPLILFLITSVLLSAAGSMFSEYYGINHYVGSTLMAVMLLSAYLIGFERFVKVVSRIAPIVIAFCLFVGIASVILDFQTIQAVDGYTEVLKPYQASPNWALSAILYLSLDFLTGGTYYTNLGASAKQRSSAKWGAIIGAVALVVAIAIMNSAILLNGEDASALAIPTLYLANKIHSLLGGAFSVILLMGMFASSSATLWSICSSFFQPGSLKNNVFALAVVSGALTLGLLPFGKLVSVFFPLIGYYGLIYIGGVAYKGIQYARHKQR